MELGIQLKGQMWPIMCRALTSIPHRAEEKHVPQGLVDCFVKLVPSVLLLLLADLCTYVVCFIPSKMLPMIGILF